MEQVLRLIDDQRARFVEELATWVKIPAISSDPKHKADMRKNAEHLMTELVRLKADRVELWETPGHPAVSALARMIASLHDDQGKVAVKGFYDKVLDLENFHLGIKSAAHSYDELSRLEEQR